MAVSGPKPRLMAVLKHQPHTLLLIFTSLQSIQTLFFVIKLIQFVGETGLLRVNELYSHLG